MEYAYATCLLSETESEINEENLQAVLEAAGSPVQESRIKATVAALEEIEVSGGTSEDETIEEGDTTDNSPETRGRSNPEPTAEE